MRRQRQEKKSADLPKSRRSSSAVYFRLQSGIVFIGGGFYYAKESNVLNDEKLVVYNWGEYIDPEVLTIFEKETGIDVIYEEFETNEILYPKISSGAIAYDVICPSDYMIQRMIKNDLLSEIDFDISRTSKTLENSIWNSQGSLIRRINTLYHIAGEPWGFFIIGQWWMSL